MASERLQERVAQAEKLLSTGHLQGSYIDAMVKYAEFSIEQEKDAVYGYKILESAKKYLLKLISKQSNGGSVWDLEKYAFLNGQKFAVLDLFYKILKLESLDSLEAFIFYMERKRDPSKRFYLPRQKTLHQVIGDLEDLANRKIKFYGLSMPSRTGKSTLCIFFLAWICLKRPNSHSAMGGHSGILAKGFYKELMNLFITDEYCFTELFNYWHPQHTVVREKSAEDFTITLDEPDRFATITCRGIDGTWTGAVDVSWDGILYVDDLVRDREHSLSPQRMENTYQEYLNKMVDRKSGFDPMDGTFAGACELMVGTLWNVLDPLERIRKERKDDPLYRFKRIPALDENDESNFQYAINGFSTEYYKEMRDRLDNAEWMAKYQQQPYVREGILFKADVLRYFNGIMPEGDYRVVTAIDVALGGGDFLSMPIGREYANGDVYIFDWVYDNGVKEQTAPKVIGKIIGNEIREARFEANVGGDIYCDYINEKLLEQGYKCSCTSKRAPNQMDKNSKIIAYSGDVIRKFVFLSPKQPTKEELENDAKFGIVRYTRSKDYQKAMEDFTSFVTIGKNDHEDGADSITQLEMFLEGYGSSAKVEAIVNPFRRFW